MRWSPFSIKSVDQFNFEPTGTHKIYTHPRYEIAAKIYYLDLIPSLLWSISNTFYVTHWWNIQKINNVLANEFHCLFLLVICTVWIKTKQCKYVDWCFFFCHSWRKRCELDANDNIGCELTCLSCLLPKYVLLGHCRVYFVVVVVGIHRKFTVWR